MKLSETGCCAVSEINGLQYHDKPEEAMRAFCDLLKKYRSKEIYDPGAFIMFSGVVRLTNGYKDDSEDEDPCEIGYGERFARYIKIHRLGSVKKSPARINRLNHPSHVVRVWLWTPVFKRLLAWSEAHQ